MTEASEAEMISAIVRLPSPSSEPLQFEPCAFERLLARLGLSEENCTDSKEVRDWCKANKNVRFIPERLLQHFGLKVSHSNF